MRTRVRTLTDVGTGCHVTLPQPDVPGAAAHRNSQTFVCGFSNFAQQPPVEVELADHLVGPVEEVLVVLERGEHEDRAPVPAPGHALAQRPAAQLGRVVLQHVAHVGRLVEHAGSCGPASALISLSAPRKSYRRGLSSFVCWSASPSSSVKHDDARRGEARPRVVGSSRSRAARSAGTAAAPRRGSSAPRTARDRTARRRSGARSGRSRPTARIIVWREPPRPSSSSDSSRSSGHAAASSSVIASGW